MKRDLSHEIPVEQLGAELAAMADVLANGQAFNRDCATEVRKGISDNFTRQGSPDASWPPRKNPSDPGRSGNPNRPILIDLGNLYEAAAETGSGHVERVEPRQVDVGVDGGTIPYAGVHNFGLGNLPQREFIAVGEDRLKRIDELVADQMLSELTG